MNEHTDKIFEGETSSTFLNDFYRLAVVDFCVGARVSAKECIVLLYGLVFRHNLTKECTNDILQFLQYILPEDTTGVPRSNYLLQKSLNVDFEKATKYYYCSNCEGPLASDEQHPFCVDCNQHCSVQALNKNDKFFFLLDMREVLKFTLETPCNGDEILKCVQRREEQQGVSDVFEDVVDGVCYKDLGRHAL